MDHRLENKMDALKKRNVQIEFISSSSDQIDEFIADKNNGGENFERPWECFELTQSQDVRKWIRDPSKIEGISDPLEKFTFWMRRLLENIKDPTILDVGCYGGYLYDFIKKFIRMNFRYTGVDICDEAIQAAQKMHVKNKDVFFKTADIYNLSGNFEPSYFDMAVCSRLFLHLPYLDKMLEQILSVAKRAVFIITLIGQKPYAKRVAEIDQRTGRRAIYYHRILGVDELRSALARQPSWEWANSSEVVMDGGYSLLVLIRKFSALPCRS